MLPQPRSEDRFGLCPLSLAATDGIDVSFFSCGYLDVSVPRVRPDRPIHSAGGTWALPQVGFPIRTSPDQRSFASSPELIAGYHVLRRLSMPRHPPYTLSSLITFTDHRHARPGCEGRDACRPSRKDARRARREGEPPVPPSRADGRLEPVTNQIRQKGARQRSTHSERLDPWGGAEHVRVEHRRGFISHLLTSFSV